MRAMLVHKKDYEVAGNKFTVQAQYQGYLASGRLAQQKHTWIFAILVNGEIIEQGPWYDLQGRNPSNEEVCDSIASVFGDSKIITEAQELGRPTLTDLELKLTGVVDYCMKFLQSYLMQEKFDYDILQQFIDENGAWEVIIQPNVPKLVDNRVFVFRHKADEAENVHFESYILDRSLNISIPF